MNQDKLKQAEHRFLSYYPDGFETPELAGLIKKHCMPQMVAFAQDVLSPQALDREDALENIIKTVTKSSMVSVFEKPKFRDTVHSMSSHEKENLISAIKTLLHGDEKKGFETLVSALAPYQLAKWTLVTVFGCYYKPQSDLLFKPTTVKKVIDFFELEGLVYQSRPTYAFFVGYRKAINDMKKIVDHRLSDTNAAFSGFLMMAVDQDK